MKAQIEGRFWLHVNDRSCLGAGRIELLEHIGATGSISAAARAMAMSYKAAWDAVEAMNNLSGQPLVLRRTGGRRGGGTELTAFGRQVIAQYRTVDAACHQFLDQLQARAPQLGDVLGFLRNLSMQTTAGNQFQGVIRSIRAGAVNDQVSVEIGAGQQIVAIVTHEAVAELGLRSGAEVQVLFDASLVMLAEGTGTLRCSARNRLCGTVQEIHAGPVSGEVKLKLAEDRVLTAVVTAEALSAPWLARGRRVCALIKAPHVMLAVPG